MKVTTITDEMQTSINATIQTLSLVQSQFFDYSNIDVTQIVPFDEIDQTIVEFKKILAVVGGQPLLADYKEKLEKITVEVTNSRIKLILLLLTLYLFDCKSVRYNIITTIFSTKLFLDWKNKNSSYCNAEVEFSQPVTSSMCNYVLKGFIKLIETKLQKSAFSSKV